MEIDQAGVREIAQRSRGTPRVANRLLKRVRDFAQVRAGGAITAEVAHQALYAQLGTQGITKKFVDAFKAKQKRDPEWYQAVAYETARALFLGIEKAATLDRDKVRDALAALDVESILPGGKLQFKQENGQQAIYPFVVQQNQPDGSSPIVWPKESAKSSGSPNPGCK